jgi:2',3'-cyclic-nucleotide 2'-phosphodiesterase/3'-nucleotidase
MKFLKILLFLIISLQLFSAMDTLYVLHTSDVHGCALPYNYFKDEPAENGLAHVFTKVQEFRQKSENVLLLDSGDMIQGTPLTAYYNRKDTLSPHPMILAYNFMQYDAIAVGNHDIEQGVETYRRAEKQSNFPWLSANAVLPDGSTYFQPYMIIEKMGLKIGILGLSTTGIQIYLEERHYPDVIWQDLVKTAKIYAEKLRPEVDLLIGLFHSGFDVEDGLEVSEAMCVPVQNAAAIIAEEVPGFDIIMAGHTHELIPSRFSESAMEEKTHFPSEPIRLASGERAHYLGVTQLIFDTETKKIITADSWLEPMKTVVPAPEITDLLEDYHLTILEYIRQDIGYTEKELSGEFSRLQDSALVELINRAQMDFTKAEISFAASFNQNFYLPSGSIKIKDIYSIYPYENYLYVVELTGEQIKEYLEFSAEYFLYEDGKMTINPAKKGYNYDMAEGISYEIDVTKEIGKRIQNLRLTKTGKPLLPDKQYQVVMNSYRALGGGGHIAAAKVAYENIIYKSDMEMREILVDYLEKFKKVNHAVDGNWKLVE